MKKLSLEAFKAKASTKNDQQELDSLIGGILGHCHHVEGPVEGTVGHQQ